MCRRVLLVCSLIVGDGTLTGRTVSQPGRAKPL
jgi:hypothetical protein